MADKSFTRKGASLRVADVPSTVEAAATSLSRPSSRVDDSSLTESIATPTVDSTVANVTDAVLQRFLSQMPKKDGTLLVVVKRANGRIEGTYIDDGVQKVNDGPFWGTLCPRTMARPGPRVSFVAVNLVEQHFRKKTRAVERMACRVEMNEPPAEEAAPATDGEVGLAGLVIIPNSLPY